MAGITFVVGARPNFMKVAPILSALPDAGGVRPLLVHTGQHYDVLLSDVFFQDLELPKPDRLLGIGSGSHADQTARIMISFEQVCLEECPDMVVVAGDVNSTLACALVAVKLRIPVGHVEAGLRSRDRSMPEEINRLLTDQISDLLFTHCEEAGENLAAEGIPPERVRFVGNSMIDSLLRYRERSTPPAFAREIGLEHRAYGLITLHRPALVDDAGRLLQMMRALGELSHELPLVFPVHPRTLARFASLELVPAETDLATPHPVGDSRLYLVESQRYLAFVHLMDHARLVITDSGGVQEETTSLGVPCITVRENTERAITIESGTNSLVGLDPDAVLTRARATLADAAPSPHDPPPLWDGRAGERIADELKRFLGS